MPKGLYWSLLYSHSYPGKPPLCTVAHYYCNLNPTADTIIHRELPIKLMLGVCEALYRLLCDCSDGGSRQSALLCWGVQLQSSASMALRIVSWLRGKPTASYRASPVKPPVVLIFQILIYHIILYLRCVFYSSNFTNRINLAQKWAYLDKIQTWRESYLDFRFCTIICVKTELRVALLPGLTICVLQCYVS